METKNASACITKRSSGQLTRAGFRIRSNRPVRPAAELKRYALTQTTKKEEDDELH